MVVQRRPGSVGSETRNRPGNVGSGTRNKLGNAGLATKNKPGSVGTGVLRRHGNVGTVVRRRHGDGIALAMKLATMSSRDNSRSSMAGSNIQVGEVGRGIGYLLIVPLYRHGLVFPLLYTTGPFKFA